MLTIQPISMNTSIPKISFQRSEAELRDDKKFYEEQKEELDKMINDNSIPQKYKTPLKIMRVVTDGAVDGIAVTCAGLAGAKYGKTSYSKFAKTGFGKTVVKLANKFNNALKGIFGSIGESLTKLKNKTKETDMYQRFANTEFGKSVIGFGKKVINKISELAKKAGAPFKTYDEGAKNISTTLGICSGIGGAYSSAVDRSEKEDKAKTAKEEKDDAVDTEYDLDNDFDEVE